MPSAPSSTTRCSADAQPDPAPDPGPRHAGARAGPAALDAALFGEPDAVDEPTTSLAAHPRPHRTARLCRARPEIPPASRPQPGPTAEADSTAVFAAVLAPESEPDAPLSRRERRRGSGRGRRLAVAALVVLLVAGLGGLAYAAFGPQRRRLVEGRRRSRCRAPT